MKQKVLEALKAKFTGVSDNVLDRVAAKVASTITSEEQVATAVEGVTFQQVLESYGDSRATEAQQSAVKNYEKKYGLKDGAKVKTEQNPEAKKDDNDDDTPAWAKALIEQNKALSEKVSAMEGAKVIETRRQQLDKVLAKLPENLRSGYKRMSLDGFSDEDFQKTLGEVTTEVDGIAQNLKSKGAIMGAPFAAEERNDGELTKEQLSAIEHRSGAPAKDAQPF